MNLTDLLHRKGIDPKTVLVLRHSPVEPKLKRVLPWFAAEKHEVFNAYQQTQTKQVEGEMARAKFVASFIGHGPGKALFIGLYSVNGTKAIGPKQYWRIQANIALRDFGIVGLTDASPRPSVLWFDLNCTDFYAEWKDKLIVRWPPLDKNWHRWAHKPRNEMSVLTVLPESALDKEMPSWDEMVLTWDELKLVPASWKAKLSEWRGIYYVFDELSNKGYVGAAYGKENLLGRWLDYAVRGHGGNRLLRECVPKNLRFSILQRLSPDIDAASIIQLESAWKKRLHTRQPFGLNDN